MVKQAPPPDESREKEVKALQVDEVATLRRELEKERERSNALLRYLEPPKFIY